MRDVVGDVLKRIDPEHRMKAFAVWSFWNDAVGVALARRAQPSGYRNGVLFVTVSTHAWMQELQYMKDTLLEHLNGRLGESMIRDIDFVSGAVEPGPSAEATTPDSTAESPPTRAIALPVIDDPELAATFERIVRAHARRIPAAAPLRRRRGRRS